MSNINRLKVVLVEKGKTGRWLANELGKSNCTVSKWCSNSIQPDLQTLDKIPKLLDVNIIVNRILKMKTYCITSEFIYHISTEIHAESEEEAK